MRLMKKFDDFCIWLYVKIQMHQLELEDQIKAVQKQRARR